MSVWCMATSNCGQQQKLMEESCDVQDPLVFADSFCPLCCTKRACFTCEKCIKNGLFYNRRRRSEESYEEKRQRLETVKKLKLNYGKRVLESTIADKSSDDLQYNVQLFRNKVSVLRKAVILLKQTEVVDKTNLTKLTDENKKRRSRLEKLKEKTKTQEKETKEKTIVIQKKQSDLDIELENISRLRRERIDQIQKYLFPISREKVFPVFGTPPDNTITETEVCDVVEGSNESCEIALTEATRTSYIEGRWVNDDHLSNLQYKILETCLPANGDYTNYGQLLKANKNGSSQYVPTGKLRNSVFSLTAGLTYTCQLLDLIAFFLDIILPKDLNYSEFCLHELSASEFRSAVSRLNANVMYLCLAQNVNSQDLRPKRTLQNIHTCLQSSNIYLGRQGPHNIYDNFGVQNDENEDDPSSSECDSDLDPGLQLSSSDNEWENINDTPLPEDIVDSGNIEPLATYNTTQQRQTTASSLVSSVTALWPWKT